MVTGEVLPCVTPLTLGDGIPRADLDTRLPKLRVAKAAVEIIRILDDRNEGSSVA
jgi:hypothetical protein